MISLDMELNHRVGGLGQRIRALREARGWSQVDLAFASRLAPTTIHKIEVGKTTSPRIDALQGIAAAFDISLEDLVGVAPHAVADLYGDDWRERAIRAEAPNTPPEQAREMLKLLDMLPSAEDREAAIRMLSGLAYGSGAPPKRKKISERRAGYGPESEQHRKEG